MRNYKNYINFLKSENNNFCKFAKLTRKFIEEHFYNVIFAYKNKLYIYHNGNVTVYNKDGNYENSFICCLNNYTFRNWKKVVTR